jgi:hypothetical protein
MMMEAIGSSETSILTIASRLNIPEGSILRKQIKFPKRCFLVFRIQDDGQRPETEQFWLLYIIATTL